MGAAIAKALAFENARLTIMGRDANRLNETARACQTRGAEVQQRLTDIRDADAMAVHVREADDWAPLDLIIANAGAAGTTTPEKARQEIIRINLLGVMNTIEPALPLMRARRHGQIAILASLAGFRGLPAAPAYSASKAGARVYGEALRPLLKPEGIDVSVICPGFVATPLTESNPFPMPLITTPEKAADRIIKGIEYRRARIAFPWPIYVVAWLFGTLPPALVDLLFSRIKFDEGT